MKKQQETQLTEEQQEFIDQILEKVPAVIARNKVEQHLGGIIASSTLRRSWTVKVSGRTRPTRPILAGLFTTRKR